ncbi:MAG: Lrp/AsnC family transcriptional regulator [Hyphomonadaceae bacterium]
MQPAIDQKDLQLMELLQRDARTSYRRLARQVGLSPSACLARVRRLEADGYIVGYRAVLARAGAGRLLEGLASVHLPQPSPQATERLLRLITATPEVVEAHRIAGRFDYALRFCAGDFDVWNAFRQRLAAQDIEADAHFNVLVETLK